MNNEIDLNGLPGTYREVMCCNCYATRDYSEGVCRHCGAMLELMDACTSKEQLIRALAVALGGLKAAYDGLDDVTSGAIFVEPDDVAPVMAELENTIHQIKEMGDE